MEARDLWNKYEASAMEKAKAAGNEIAMESVELCAYPLSYHGRWKVVMNIPQQVG